MQAFVGLALFLVFTVSNGVVILITVEQSGKNTWYGLANVETLDNSIMKVIMVKTEVAKISKDNPDPFVWEKGTPCKFQFIPYPSTTRATSLSGIAVENNWIRATMRESKFILQLSTEVLLSAVGTEAKFQGYKTTSNGLLLFMSPDLYNDSKQLFTNDNNTYNLVEGSDTLKSNAKVFVEWILETGGDSSKTLLLINFDGVSKGAQKVKDADSTLGYPNVTYKCYVMLGENETTQYGQGEIDFQNTNATLRIEQLWNIQNQVYAKLTREDMNNLLKNPRTFSIADRDVVTTWDSRELAEVFLFSLVVRPLPNTTFELASGEFGFEFSLGKAGSVEFEYNGTQTLPVYYYPNSKVLTFIGEEVISALDNFRLFINAANEKIRAEQVGKDRTEQVALMKLFDLPTDTSQLFYTPPTLIGSVSIPDVVEPKNAHENVFKYRLFQCKYILFSP